jgi:hypothetical protein
MKQDALIRTLGLTVRSEVCLKAQEIYTIKQLLECTEHRILDMPNLGRKALREIVGRLNECGLKLKGVVMTREELIQLAREHALGGLEFDVSGLEQFAKFVAAAERKECAKQLDALGCDHCAAAIRARGQS